MLILTRLFPLILALLLCAPAKAADMDNTERIFQTSFGVITAFGLKKQLDADPQCKTKSFANFDLNQFLDAIPKDFLTKPNQRQGIAQQFSDYFLQLDQIVFPSGKNLAVTYQDLKQSPAVVEHQQKAGGDASAYCDKIYSHASDVFQKQIDSIKQLVVRK
jgi:hypothetical protein